MLHTKEYILSFSKRKKIAFIISCVLFFFEAFAPLMFFILNKTYDPLSNHSAIFEWISSCINISFLTSNIIAFYLFAFPIAYFLINAIIFARRKYSRIVLLIDLLFQIINPLILISTFWVLLGLLDTIKPQF